MFFCRVWHVRLTLDVDIHGWTPLYAAANNGHIELVNCLMEYGADVDSPGISLCNRRVIRISYLCPTDEEGWTPLHASARNGNVKMVKCLIGHGANVHSLSMLLRRRVCFLRLT
jgi:ankyrin repeat protein